MSEVEAVYEDGVFKPLGKVDLTEHQRVRLSIRAVDPGDWKAWLERVQEVQRRFIEQHGYLPDSTPEIRADRYRDE